MLFRSGKTIFILSAYRPCPHQHKDLAHSNSTYAQQYFQIQQSTPSTQPDPQFHFIVDLTSYIKSWRATSSDIIILIMDANEDLGHDKKGLTQLLQDTGLIDIFY